IRDDMDLILLRAGAFDTQEADQDRETQTSAAAPVQRGLYLVQMRGPIKPEWLAWLKRSSTVITYIPNYAYLVPLSLESLSEVKPAAAGGLEFVQWVAPYKPSYKSSPRIPLDLPGSFDLTVQLVRTPGLHRDLAEIGTLSESGIGRPLSVLNYVDVTLSAGRDAIAQLAAMTNVLWIEPATETRMFDERQDQIIAGNFTGNQLAAPGYVNWL